MSSNRNSLTSVLSLALLVPMLSGCIGIPVAFPEGKPFKEVVAEQLVPGTTNRAELVELLGRPFVEDRGSLVFRDSRDGWRWLFCGGAYYTGGCAATDRTSKDFFLVADFDEFDKLHSAEIYTEHSLCEQRKICPSRGLLMQAEHNLSALPNHDPSMCTVNIFSDTASDDASGEVEVDGQYVGDLVGKKGVYTFGVHPGRHFIVVVPQGALLHGTAGKQVIDCVDGENHYLRYDTAFFGVKLASEDSTKAEPMVAERWMARAAPHDKGDRGAWLRNGEVFVSSTAAGTTRVYVADDLERTRWWGTNFNGEHCGIVPAIEDYGLNPAGGQRELYFAMPGKIHYVLPICTEDDNCEMPSPFAGASCQIDTADYVSYRDGATVIVIEPAEDGYREVLRAERKQLKGYVSCDNFGACHLSVENIRLLAAESGM